MGGFSGWNSYSNMSVSNDVGIGIRVDALEKSNDKIQDLHDRVIRLESAVSNRSNIKAEVSYLSKEVAVLESQLKSIEREGRASSADIQDLKVTLSKIVTILKNQGGRP